ncbi:permease [Pseudomonas sp. NPDC087342]|uniref:permease n=1 Tax=Pseudomonas sp. NPDC087342 TaxID=3364437 RepID=UPI00381F29CF
MMLQKNHESQPHPSEKTEYQMADSTPTSPPTSTTIMECSTTTIAASPKKTTQAQIYIVAAFFFIFLYVLWLTWGNLKENISTIIAAGATLAIFAAYSILLGARQKTVFKYIINKDAGFLEYFLYYPDFTNLFFKITPILIILFFIGVALCTGSLLFLVGPVAIALGSACFLLGWKNEVHTRKSTPWNEYNFVTIDHKRLMVIVHRTDPTLGFEARLPNKNSLDQYLITIKKLLPSTAIYTENSWEW